MKQESITPIGPNGEATGPTEYTLRISHDEIHLLYWALRLAEAFKAQEDMEEVLYSTMVYINFRLDYPGIYDSFVAKFDRLHLLAMENNDGEIEKV